METEAKNPVEEPEEVSDEEVPVDGALDTDEGEQENGDTL